MSPLIHFLLRLPQLRLFEFSPNYPRHSQWSKFWTLLAFATATISFSWFSSTSLTFLFLVSKRNLNVHMNSAHVSHPDYSWRVTTPDALLKWKFSVCGNFPSSKQRVKSHLIKPLILERHCGEENVLLLWLVSARRKLFHCFFRGRFKLELWPFLSYFEWITSS